MPGGKGIFPNLSVRENLVLGSWMNDDQIDVAARLADVFEIFPALRERIDTLAGQLSGGEQQQLSLAQAFLCKPQLLLIDELSLGLAPAVVGQLVEIVKEINRRGVTVIVVEQSVNVALTIATRAVFMEKGEVRFDGPADELLARPDILRAVYVKGTGALTDGAPGGARRGDRDALLAGSGDARPVLEVDGLVEAIRRGHGRRRCELRSARGPGARDDRAQRRGQDHDLRSHQRAPGRRRGRGAARGRRHHVDLA